MLGEDVASFAFLLGPVPGTAVTGRDKATSFNSDLVVSAGLGGTTIASFLRLGLDFSELMVTLSRPDSLLGILETRGD